VLVGLARSNHAGTDRQNNELRCRSAVGAIHESRSRSKAGAAITEISQDLGRNAFLDRNRTRVGYHGPGLWICCPACVKACQLFPLALRKHVNYSHCRRSGRRRKSISARTCFALQWVCLHAARTPAIVTRARPTNAGNFSHTRLYRLYRGNGHRVRSKWQRRHCHIARFRREAHHHADARLRVSLSGSAAIVKNRCVRRAALCTCSHVVSAVVQRLKRFLYYLCAALIKIFCFFLNEFPI
jgi:hypothetical protein